MLHVLGQKRRGEASGPLAPTAGCSGRLGGGGSGRSAACSRLSAGGLRRVVLVVGALVGDTFFAQGLFLDAGGASAEPLRLTTGLALDVGV